MYGDLPLLQKILPGENRGKGGKNPQELILSYVREHRDDEGRGATHDVYSSMLGQDR